MDIPLFKTFNSKTPIDIQTQNGVVQLFPLHSKRGTGKQKWCLSIEGLVKEKVTIMEQCYVFFQGNELGGNFSKVKESSKPNNLWIVTFETIIPAPEFWGDIQ